MYNEGWKGIKAAKGPMADDGALKGGVKHVKKERREKMFWAEMAE
jgi:hypothetical protein